MIGREGSLVSPEAGRSWVETTDELSIRMKLLNIVSEQREPLWNRLTGVKTSEYRKNVQKYAYRREDYAGLPERYRNIAIEAAVAALEIPENVYSLARTAKALDALAPEEPYIQHEILNNGSILMNMQEASYRLQRAFWPADKIVQSIAFQMRVGIASRLAATGSAKIAEWQSGWDEHPYFALAASLASGAVTEVHGKI